MIDWASGIELGLSGWLVDIVPGKFFGWFDIGHLQSNWLADSDPAADHVLQAETVDEPTQVFLSCVAEFGFVVVVVVWVLVVELLVVVETAGAAIVDVSPLAVAPAGFGFADIEEAELAAASEAADFEYVDVLVGHEFVAGVAVVVDAVVDVDAVVVAAAVDAADVGAVAGAADVVDAAAGGRDGQVEASGDGAAATGTRRNSNAGADFSGQQF